MSYSKTINLAISERATVEVETEFDITPGMPTRRYDVDPGWPAELYGMTYAVTEIRFSSGTTIDNSWMAHRGFLPIVERLLDTTEIEDKLGCLDDYLNDEGHDNG